jgi:hypothetical protein
MRNLILAAMAALSLGIGSAYAAQTLTNRLGQEIYGPAFNDNTVGSQPLAFGQAATDLRNAKGSASGWPLFAFWRRSSSENRTVAAQLPSGRPPVNSPRPGVGRGSF